MAPSPSRSISQNPEFFYGYLRQGQMRYKLDRYNASRSSLEESLDDLRQGEFKIAQ